MIVDDIVRELDRFTFSTLTAPNVVRVPAGMKEDLRKEMDERCGYHNAGPWTWSISGCLVVFSDVETIEAAFDPAVDWPRVRVVMGAP